MFFFSGLFLGMGRINPADLGNVPSVCKVRLPVFFHSKKSFWNKSGSDGETKLIPTFEIPAVGGIKTFMHHKTFVSWQWAIESSTCEHTPTRPQL